MRLQLIQTTSRPWMDDIPAGEVRPERADQATQVLRTDYERWSRWWIGLASYLLVIVASFVAMGMTAEVISLTSRPSTSQDPIAVAWGIGAALLWAAAAFGVLVLIRLWMTGHQLISAATQWMRLPYRSGMRPRRASGWVTTRTVNFEPRVFARITTAAISMLFAIFGISLLIRDIMQGFEAVSFLAGIIGLASLVCGLGQIGGVLRLVSGLSESDPIWVWIRNRFRGK